MKEYNQLINVYSIRIINAIKNNFINKIKLFYKN